jgi:hypothetical protein
VDGFVRNLAIAVFVTAALGWAAAPAGADTNLGTVAGLTYIQGTSTPPAPPPSVLASSATCPAGTHVAGGGAAWSSATTATPIQFWLNRSRPFDGPDPDTQPDDGWLGRGFNRSGTNKGFVAYAICLAGSVSYVTAGASAPAGRGMTAKAWCPSGTHVAGGGATVAGSASASYLNASHPFDSGDADTRPDDGWRARGFNQSGVRKRLVVYGECVALNPRYATSSATGTDPLLFTPCPAGTHAMGGGALPAGPPSRAFLNILYPYAASVNPPDTGFVAWIHTIGGPLELKSYAVCKT